MERKFPLHDAVQDGKIDEVKRLLKKCVDIEKRGDRYGRTPFNMAANYNRIEIAKLLLDKGADVDTQDDLGVTPLHWVAERGYTDFAKLLMKKDAKINIKDENGNTPLFYAEYHGKTEIVNLLKKRTNDMTEEKLKIPGKIVGVSTHGGLTVIATETQVIRCGISGPDIIFDITEYQDKPTEDEIKETKDKEAARNIRRVFLTDFLGVQLQVFIEVYGNKKNKKIVPPGFMSDVLRAIAELNAMDAEDAKS